MISNIKIIDINDKKIVYDVNQDINYIHDIIQDDSIEIKINKRLLNHNSFLLLLDGIPFFLESIMEYKIYVKSWLNFFNSTTSFIREKNQGIRINKILDEFLIDYNLWNQNLNLEFINNSNNKLVTSFLTDEELFDSELFISSFNLKKVLKQLLLDLEIKIDVKYYDGTIKLTIDDNNEVTKIFTNSDLVSVDSIPEFELDHSHVIANIYYLTNFSGNKGDVATAFGCINQNGEIFISTNEVELPISNCNFEELNYQYDEIVTSIDDVKPSLEERIKSYLTDSTKLEIILSVIGFNNLMIGSSVEIIHYGKSYTTALTGIEITDTTKKLIFGNSRNDFLFKIKGGK